MHEIVKKSTAKLPFVSILIVNFNGRGLLADCLSSLRKIRYPKNRYEVILVDNHSMDDSCIFVRRAFPWVKLVEAKENLGFTGGNNLAFQHAVGDLVVLLNTDTTVDKNWLMALVQSAEKHPNVGIFSSRLRFAHPFLRLRISTKPIQRSELEESIDFSPLGVMLEDVHCSESQLDHLIWYDRGFYNELEGTITARWTKNEAEILLPIPLDSWNKEKPFTYDLTFHGYRTDQLQAAPVRLSWGDAPTFATLSIQPRTVEQVSVTVRPSVAKKHAFWLIQNAGNVLLKDGHSKDRGGMTRHELRGKSGEHYEAESPHFLREKPLTAFCGASCLIRREVVRDIDFLDGHYYMYYEDVEYSMRAWRMGWDLLYVPDSIVYHRHKGTTGKTSKVFFIHMTERNHLFVTLTHYEFIVFARQFLLFLVKWGISVLYTFAHFLRDDVAKYHRWREIAIARTLAMRDFLKQAPGLLRKKWFFAQKSKRDLSELRKLMY